MTVWSPRAGPAQTTESLVADLRRLGVRPGETLLVHSSLRSLGWVSGGAPTVVRALLEVLGPDGTVVVPAQTADNRDPSRWLVPPPESWWAELRNHVAAFDPGSTPSCRMGAIAECVRTWPGAVRSGHPQTSFAAVGFRAARLLAGHRLEAQLGEASPLARLADIDARILLLGVDFDRCTAFHLAEHRLPDPPIRPDACAIRTQTGRAWVTFAAVALDASDFGALGHDLEAETDLVTTGPVGHAPARILPLPDAVDYAQKWLIAHR